MDKYTRELLDCASKLDAMISACGNITSLANRIAVERSTEDTIQLVKRLAEIAETKDYSSETKKMAAILKDDLVRFYGHNVLKEICEQANETDVNDIPLSELMMELNNLVGLKNVKEKVNDLIVYQNVQKLRRENDLYSVKSTLHMAFLGNPGTGKTTVARIVGKMYKQLGLLSKGHFIEVSRTDLIAGYQGQTALKVKNVIEKAKGGVLFIDEAYSITENDHTDSYGRECLTELTKALEDYRDDLVVIVAGYTAPMNKFFESNPGLRSRFNIFIDFNDYTSTELMEILDMMCKINDYELSESAKDKIGAHFEKIIKEKDDNFANGRLVRNIYDDIVMNHARRVISIDKPSKKELCLITDSDFNYD